MRTYGAFDDRRKYMGVYEMKVEIIKECQDKITGELYRVGDVIDLDEERVLNAPKGYLKKAKVKKNA